MLKITLLSQRPFSVPLVALACLGSSTLSSSEQMGATFGCGLSPMLFLFSLSLALERLCFIASKSCSFRCVSHHAK